MDKPIYHFPQNLFIKSDKQPFSLIFTFLCKQGWKIIPFVFEGLLHVLKRFVFRYRPSNFRQSRLINGRALHGLTKQLKLWICSLLALNHLYKMGFMCFYFIQVLVSLFFVHMITFGWNWCRHWANFIGYAGHTWEAMKSDPFVKIISTGYFGYFQWKIERNTNN